MYLLDRDFTTFLIMGFTGDKADKFKMEYIKAFNQMEDIIKNGVQVIDSYMIDNPIERAKRWIEEEQERVALRQTVKEQQPKVEYHDEVLNKVDLITTTLVAKDLGMTAYNLNNILITNGILYKNKNETYYPKKKYQFLISEKYCDYQSYANEKAKPILKWTEKGRKWIIENISNWS